MSKRNFDISKQMQHDLIEAYKQVCPTCWSQQQAYERMVLQPAPRFYITPKQACSVISQMIKGDFERVNLMMPRRREMYYALYDEVVKLSDKREYIGKSLSYILKFAVVQPAPQFFISPVRAKIIRSFVRNDVYDEEGRVRDDRLPSYVRTREAKRNKITKKEKWTLEKMSEEEEVQLQ